MKVSLIVAYAENRVMGKGNDLPWRLPADLAHFKRETLGKAVIMGRKTWDSIGFPLPKRRNIVLSKSAPDLPEGVECYRSLEEALAAFQDGEEVMIIGGATIYDQALKSGVDEILLTKVMAEVEGDVFFPQWDEKNWRLVEENFRPADENNLYDMTFCRYESREA